MYGPEYIPSSEERKRWVALANMLLFGDHQGEFPERSFPMLHRRMKADRIVDECRALDLVDPVPMGPEELAVIVKRLGGRPSTARLLDMSPGQVFLWLRGAPSISPRSAAILRHLAATLGLDTQAWRGREP